MHKSDITYEQLGRAFRRYLSERFDGDAEEVSLTAETAERIIPNTLNEYFGTQYASIYDITEIGDVEEFRRKIKTHPILKNLDMIRQACINYYKALHGGYIVCECCGFDFTKAYDIDDEYIEIHHRFPFSQTEGEHPVNSQTDLVPLCANCHRMIHHGQGGKGNCMSLEELKRKYKGIRYKNE